MNDDTIIYDTVEKLCNSGTVYKSITENEFEQLLLKGGKKNGDKILEYRSPDNNKQIREKLKSQLPGICFQARFKPEARNKYNIVSLTSEIFIDEDGYAFDENKKVIKFTSIEQAREKRNSVIAEHGRFIKYAYDSAAGRNHYVIRVNGLREDNYLGAVKYIAEMLGIITDPYGNSISRLAALSYDPNAYINRTLTDRIDVSEIPDCKKKKVLIGVSNNRVSKQTEGKHKFFCHSYADIHLEDFLRDNLDKIIYYPEGYVVCIDKLPMTKLIGRKRLILDGERNCVLFRDFSLYVSLNACNQTYEQLYRGLMAYNQKWCSPAMEEEEVNKIFSKVMDRYETGNLKVESYLQNGAWYLSTKLTSTEKKSLSSRARKHINIIHFLNNLNNLSLTNDEKKSYSVKDISCKLNISQQSIYNYIDFIHEMIPEHIKSKHQILALIEKGSNFKNDIYSRSIYNIILYYMGEVGLYDFGILTPRKSIAEVIAELLNAGHNPTKKLIAEAVGCSESTIKRSKDWKLYSTKSCKYQIPNRASNCHETENIPANISSEIADLVNPVKVANYRKEVWYTQLSDEDKIFCDQEVPKSSISDVWLTLITRDFIRPLTNTTCSLIEMAQ